MKLQRRLKNAVKKPRPPLTVEWAPIDNVQPDPFNARRHSKAQIWKIAQSIQEFDFNSPILVDRDGKVLSGKPRPAERPLPRSIDQAAAVAAAQVW